MLLVAGAAAARDPLQGARDALARGEAGEAVSLLEQQLEQGPQDVSLLVLLAEAQVLAGQPESAALTLEQAVELSPDVVSLWGQLGEARLRAGEAAGAVRAWDHAARLAPDDPQWLHRSGLLLARARLWEQALPRLEEAAHRGKGRADLVYDLALAQQRAGNSLEALESWRRCLRIDPERASAWLNMGVLLFESKRLAAARRALERARQLAPESGRAAYNLGLVLWELKHPVEARQALEQARELGEQSPELDYMLGVALADAGQNRAAITSLERAVAGLRHGHAALEKLLALLLLEQQLERAGQLVEEHLELAVAEPELGLLAARVLEWRGEVARARELLERLLEQHPQAVDAHYALAQQLIAAGERDAARQRLERFRELERARQAREDAVKRASVLLREGLGALGEGEPEQAVEVFEQALELDPGLYAARIKLAVAELRLVRLERAEQRAREAVARRSWDPEAHLVLGLALLEQGRAGAAREELALALALDPFGADARPALAEWLERAGDADSARRLRVEALGLPGGGG